MMHAAPQLGLLAAENIAPSFMSLQVTDQVKAEAVKYDPQFQYL
jgi:hypothetical protein